MQLRMIILCCLFAATAQTASAQEEGQSPTDAAAAQAGQVAGAGTPEAAIATQLTFRSHSIAAATSANSLEGDACPAPTKMVSGACHPFFTDQVAIINQFPNIAANTWRCGFRNNSASTRTVWVYTLCAQ